MKSITKTVDWRVLELHKKDPLDVSMSVFVSIKCPNCQKIIRFKLGGTYGLGWSLRTFYCKACQQTHSVTMFFETKKIEKATPWNDLTQSLWRAHGARVLKHTQNHYLVDVAVNNPAKLLGYSSSKIAKWLQAFTHVFISHLESTKGEKGLHAIENESILKISTKLKHLHHLLYHHTSED